MHGFEWARTIQAAANRERVTMLPDAGQRGAVTRDKGEAETDRLEPRLRLRSGLLPHLPHAAVLPPAGGADKVEKRFRQVDVVKVMSRPEERGVNRYAMC
jgi:hypothetical protein